MSHCRAFGFPDYVQFDNDTVFQGPRHPGALSRVARMAISLGVIPVFTPPRETGFHASIESYNGRWQSKEWSRFHFESREHFSDYVAVNKGAYSHAPLWAYSAAADKQLFAKHCASCHRVQNQGTDIGPKLVGSGAKGGRYFIENIVDPNAVVGNGFQTWLILTDDGRVVTGLIEQSTDTGGSQVARFNLSWLLAGKATGDGVIPGELTK